MIDAAQTADQIFVLAKQWVLGYSPAALRPLLSAVLSVVPVLIAFPLLFAHNDGTGAQGAGADSEPLRAEPRGDHLGSSSRLPMGSSR